MLSGNARSFLQIALADAATATEIANAIDAASSGGATLAGNNAFTGNNTHAGTEAFNDGLSVGDAQNIALGSTTGTKLGTSTTQKLGLWNATPIVQRAGSAQAAVATTASTVTTPFGYTTQAQADGIVTLLNELRAALVAMGAIKGSA